MRHSLIFILMFAIASILADNVLVLKLKDGTRYAKNVNDIDSIFHEDNDTLPEEWFSWTDTVHETDTLLLTDTIHVTDTMCVTDTICLTDTVCLKDTVCLTDTLLVTDTLCLSDTICITDTLLRTDTIHETEYVYRDVKCVNSTDSWHFSVENPVVADYMNVVDYTNYCDDYSFSSVREYCVRPTEYDKSRPAAVNIEWQTSGAEQVIQLSLASDFAVLEDVIAVPDGATEYAVTNLKPGMRYYYRVLAGGSVVKESHFFTIGQVRMMNLPSVDNIRDIGGWVTNDGRRIKYGRIYRGGEMNPSVTVSQPDAHIITSADSTYMHDVMLIRCVVDLRDDRDMNLNDDDPTNDRNYSVLGDDVKYINEQVNHNSNVFTRGYYYYTQKWARALKTIIETLQDGQNAYFHCTWGADRTGTLAMLIEGLLGVPEADLTKDYELTALCQDRYRDRTTEYWEPNLTFIKSLGGATLRDKFETFFKDAGLSKQNIETFRAIMLE